MEIECQNDCIDLWKLNARMIKNAYSLPKIDETLDCLHGAEWFSPLDLKSRYWQVEMEENSKALTAFTIGPLGFYKCECHFPTVDAKLFWQFTFMLLHYLSC